MYRDFPLSLREGLAINLKFLFGAYCVTCAAIMTAQLVLM